MAPHRRKKRSERPPDAPEAFDLRVVLAEQAVPSTPEQWFSERWRLGPNAIRLGLALVEQIVPTEHDFVQKVLHVFIETKILGDLYWTIQDLKSEIRAESEHNNLLNEPLEMIQKFSAKSDGGGEVYNQILLRMCNQHLANGGTIESIEPTVRRWRARDYVWLDPDQPEPADPATQRRLRTFEQFWQRGLFSFAFCIK